MEYGEYLNPKPSQHDWYVETDHEKNQIFQGCTCGWKTRVRDFYGAWCTYDVANSWVEHLEGKPGD